MHNMMLIIKNILSVTFRKKGNIVVYLFLPLVGVILSMILYGNSSETHMNLGLINHDTGTLAEDLLSVIKVSGSNIIYDVQESDVNTFLLDKKLDAVIVIPEGYADGIYSGEPKNIEMVSIKGMGTTVWLCQLIDGYTDTLLKLSAASGSSHAVFEQMYEQYKSATVKLSVERLDDKLTSKNMTLTSMGFLIMFIMLGSGFITMIILKEKKDRTYHRICSAPVKAGQYIVANALSSLLVIIVQILLIQLIMKYLLHIDTGLKGFYLFVILLLFGIVAIGIGLVITAFSGSSYIAGTLSTLILTPTCMLGGCFWEISLMPEFMQKLSRFVPQWWAMNAIQKLQQGSEPASILINLLILASFAAALLLVATYRFSRTDNVQKFV